jgi:hypothetical protein
MPIKNTMMSRNRRSSVSVVETHRSSTRVLAAAWHRHPLDGVPDQLGRQIEHAEQTTAWRAAGSPHLPS